LFTSILFNKRQLVFVQGCGIPQSKLIIQYGLVRYKMYKIQLSASRVSCVLEMESRLFVYL